MRSIRFDDRLPFEEEPELSRRHKPDIRCEMVRRLGYARKNRVRLYGEVFDLLSDPVVVGENSIFLDALQVESGYVTRIRIPESVVEKARIRYLTGLE
jgi:hypothetical protein